nr:hypothetical protein [Tanacetum cinerariifolium]
MDVALVPHAKRLRIGRSNFRLSSDIKSKESTLQLVYDALRLCPFFKAFLVTADVPEIYIPRVHGQTFAEPPFEEEIIAFICFLGHSAAIRTFTDVNVNKLYQPWRSFAAIINKCLTEKSSGYDSLRLSQAQILSCTTKPKASVRTTRSSSDTSITPLTAAASPRLAASIKGKQKAKSIPSQKSISPLKDEGTSSIPRVLDAPTDESEKELSWNSIDDEGADNEGKDGDDDEEDEGDDGEEGDGDDDEDDDGEEGNDDDDDQEVKRDDDKDDEKEGGDDDQEYDDEHAKETRDEESFDPIPKPLKISEDEGNGEEDIGLNSHMELYIENRENGRMINNSFQNGPLAWPTIIEENGTTRTKKYVELSVAEKLQADCDFKATKVVLQCLLPDVPPFKPIRIMCNKFKGDKEKVILVLAIRIMLLVLEEIMQEGRLEFKGNMSRKYTQPKRLTNVAWFKEKELLAEAHESGQNVDEEKLAFLADRGIPNGHAT